MTEPYSAGVFSRGRGQVSCFHFPAPCCVVYSPLSLSYFPLLLWEHLDTQVILLSCLSVVLSGLGCWIFSTTTVRLVQPCWSLARSGHRTGRRCLDSGRKASPLPADRPNLPKYAPAPLATAWSEKCGWVGRRAVILHRKPQTKPLLRAAPRSSGRPAPGCGRAAQLMAPLGQRPAPAHRDGSLPSVRAKVGKRGWRAGAAAEPAGSQRDRPAAAAALSEARRRRCSSPPPEAPPPAAGRSQGAGLTSRPGFPSDRGRGRLSGAAAWWRRSAGLRSRRRSGAAPTPVLPAPLPAWSGPHCSSGGASEPAARAARSRQEQRRPPRPRRGRGSRPRPGAAVRAAVRPAGRSEASGRGGGLGRAEPAGPRAPQVGRGRHGSLSRPGTVQLPEMKARGGGGRCRVNAAPLPVARGGVDARRRADSSGPLRALRREKEGVSGAEVGSGGELLPRAPAGGASVEPPGRPESSRGSAPGRGGRRGKRSWRAVAVALEALPESGARAGRADSGAGGRPCPRSLWAGGERAARAAGDERRDRVGPEQGAGGGEEVLPPPAVFPGRRGRGSSCRRGIARRAPDSPAGSPVALRGPAVAAGLLPTALPSLIAIVRGPERPGGVSAGQCPSRSEGSLPTAPVGSGLGCELFEGSTPGHARP